MQAYDDGESVDAQPEDAQSSSAWWPFPGLTQDVQSLRAWRPFSGLMQEYTDRWLVLPCAIAVVAFAYIVNQRWPGTCMAVAGVAVAYLIQASQPEGWTPLRWFTGHDSETNEAEVPTEEVDQAGEQDGNNEHDGRGRNVDAEDEYPWTALPCDMKAWDTGAAGEDAGGLGGTIGLESFWEGDDPSTLVHLGAAGIAPMAVDNGAGDLDDMGAMGAHSSDKKSKARLDLFFRYMESVESKQNKPGTTLQRQKLQKKLLLRRCLEAGGSETGNQTGGAEEDDLLEDSGRMEQLVRELGEVGSPEGGSGGRLHKVAAPKKAKKKGQSGVLAKKSGAAVASTAPAKSATPPRECKPDASQGAPSQTQRSPASATLETSEAQATATQQLLQRQVPNAVASTETIGAQATVLTEAPESTDDEVCDEEAKAEALMDGRSKQGGASANSEDADPSTSLNGFQVVASRRAKRSKDRKDTSASANSVDSNSVNLRSSGRERTASERTVAIDNKADVLTGVREGVTEGRTVDGRSPSTKKETESLLHATNDSKQPAPTLNHGTSASDQSGFCEPTSSSSHIGASDSGGVAAKATADTRSSRGGCVEIAFGSIPGDVVEGAAGDDASGLGRGKVVDDSTAVPEDDEEEEWEWQCPDGHKLEEYTCVKSMRCSSCDKVQPQGSRMLRSDVSGWGACEECIGIAWQQPVELLRQADDVPPDAPKESNSSAALPRKPLSTAAPAWSPSAMTGIATELVPDPSRMSALEIAEWFKQHGREDVLQTCMLQVLVQAGVQQPLNGHERPP